MSKKADKNGRPYADIRKLKAGDTVETDGDFTCVPSGRRKIFSDPERKGVGSLYFRCKSGQHFLDGQCDDGRHCIGVYAA